MTKSERSSHHRYVKEFMMFEAVVIVAKVGVVKESLSNSILEVPAYMSINEGILDGF